MLHATTVSNENQKQHHEYFINRKKKFSSNLNIIRIKNKLTSNSPQNNVNKIM